MAVNEVTSVDVKTLTPFKRFIMTLGELPTSYLESMTYAELVMWFCNFLQEKVIPTVNNNADALQDVIHYLENLDLQDEVNNKLDEMAESGQLQEIVAEYLNSKAVFGYDTVEDMQSATNLIDGSYAKTLGYHEKNDDGKALYKIRNITNSDIVDNCSIIALDNEELIAEYIADTEINVKQFGAYGDGTNDDTLAIQTAINYAEENEILDVYFPNGFYKITESLEITKAINLKGAISTLYNTNTDVKSASLYWDGETGETMVKIPTGYFVNGYSIENIGFNGNSKSVTCIDLIRAKYTRINNCSFTHFGTGIAIENNSYHNIIEKCWFRSYETYGINIKQGTTPANSQIIRENIFTLTSNNYGIYINNANAVIIMNNMMEGSGGSIKPIFIEGGNNTNGIAIISNRIEISVNEDSNQTPDYLITIENLNPGFCANNISIRSNALYCQITKNGTVTVNPYYYISNKAFSNFTDFEDSYNLIKNPTLELNGSNMPYYWKTNSAHVSFVAGNKNKIVISGETVKYPNIYQFIDVKKYRGKRLYLSAKFKCLNATSTPLINGDFYKGGTKKITDRGTYLSSMLLSTKAYSNEEIIQTAYVNVPEDADHLYMNINFNGNNSATPADNEMTIDFINISSHLITSSNYIDDAKILEVYPSNNRPTGIDGLTIFDNTLNKTITYYNGLWYDGTGTSV